MATPGISMLSPRRLRSQSILAKWLQPPAAEKLP